MTQSETITIVLPKGNQDTIKSVETRTIDDTPGVYELRVNDKPGRLLIDLNSFEQTEEDESRLIIAVRTAFHKYHQKPLNKQE